MTRPRYVEAPKIYLISKQTVLDSEIDRFLRDEGVEKWSTDTEEGGQIVSEFAGRVCYMSFARPRPGGNAAYLSHIAEVQHGSVYEHAVFMYQITGVSRSLTHELVRHRAGMAYSQLSQRYVDSGDTQFVIPPAILALEESSPEILQIFKEAAEASRIAYERLEDALTRTYRHQKYFLDHPENAVYTPEAMEHWWKSLPAEARTSIIKRSREAARSVLPNATETKIAVTANARAWRHFLEMRASVHADREIRRLAVELGINLKAQAPNLFADFELRHDGEGIPYFEARFRKI